MNVLQDEEHRLVRCEALEYAENEVERPLAVARLIRRSSIRRKLGKERGENRAQGAKHLSHLGTLSSGDTKPERIHQGGIRDRGLGAGASPLDDSKIAAAC